tara:strand:- start:209 stop:457 length:249 start_codon:yes stop_codon:yes gene_type:complete
MKWLEKDRNNHTITSVATTGTTVSPITAGKGQKLTSDQTKINEIITANAADYNALAIKLNELTEIIEDLMALYNNDETRVEI